MLRAALEDDGWTVEMALGAGDERLAELVRSLRPRFAGVTAGHLASPQALGARIGVMRALGPPVLVGGQAFRRAPALWRQVGATAWAPDLRVGLVLARRTTGGRTALGAGAA
jgi:hypothetical protein